MEQHKLQHRLLILFCIIAAIRVGIYSAAFPFFNNVDEEAHFDLVMKYNQGHIPDSMELISPISADYISGYRSNEFFNQPYDFPEQRLPAPLWESPKEEAQNRFTEKATYWRRITNHESTHAPLYYALAATWLKIGQVSGIIGSKGILLLYWIRFLNVLLVIGLVCISYRAARIAFPGNKVMAICVPMFTAVLPQDTYYSIQSDVLSPFCYGLAFVAMLQFIRSAVPSLKGSFFAGIAIALTVLVKTSNLPLLVVVLTAVAIKSYRVFRSGRFNEYKNSLLAFTLCAFIPICTWVVWNLYAYGDVTGSEKKIEILGWAKKPVSEWIHGGLFSAHGAFEFWSELMASFWRGEFVWARVRLAVPAADIFYWASSLLFVIASLIGIYKIKDLSQRMINNFTVWSFLSVIIFMIFLSVSFDFSESYYPSREHPYFTSGRLISGALIPFLILYVLGFEKLFAWIKNERVSIFLLSLVAIGITLSEFILNRVTFGSHFNLFHCPG